jgi:hypothetical protein
MRAYPRATLDHQGVGHDQQAQAGHEANRQRERNSVDAHDSHLQSLLELVALDHPRCPT